MLGDDLEAWLAESALMKRTFRTNAVIAGLIERRFPGKEKTRRQVTISTDLIYDVLRKHQPDHVLLRAARADAATGLLDIRRLGEMLSRIKGRIVHKALEQVSPLAVPVMLEIGREMVYGEASDTLLAEAADELVAEAMGAGWGRIGRFRPAKLRCAASACAAIPPARSIGRRNACWWSPICISKKDRASRAAACCCRLMTPPRRSRGSARSSPATIRARVIALGDSFHDGEGPQRLSAADRETLVGAASRPRLDLDCRQSRSRSGRRTSAASSRDCVSIGPFVFRHEPVGLR